MKYLAIASFAALAAASPALDARDGWEKADPNTWAPVVKPTTTWAPVVITTKKVVAETWAPYVKDTAVWDEWNKKPVYTTTVVTAITTYCPEPTTMVHAGKTYTITKATTLTITDCPCTISVPVYVKTSTICDNSPAPTWAGYPDTPVKGASTWAGYPDTPVKGASTWAGYPDTAVKGASTWSDVPVKGASTWSGYPASTTTGWNPVATWKGAADKVNVGAGLAGVVGIAALLL